MEISWGFLFITFIFYSGNVHHPFSLFFFFLNPKLLDKTKPIALILEKILYKFKYFLGGRFHVNLFILSLIKLICKKKILLILGVKVEE